MNPYLKRVKKFIEFKKAGRKYAGASDNRIKNKLGRIEEQFNSEGYQEAFITNSIVFPDLTATKLQTDYGALGAYDLLQKMLSADELANLQIKISGFAEEEIIENTMDNLVEEAKN